MKIIITPYKPEDVEAVVQFNRRLSASRTNVRFPASHESNWLPHVDGRHIFMDFFLAKEGNAVRGGYILKYQRFFMNGKTLKISLYKQPISEGIVNKSYVTVGVQLLLDALKRQPILFTLGIGSYSDPVAKMLKLFKWGMFSVPFYFKVLNPFPFLRNINFLRRKRMGRIALDILAFTGTGILGLYLLKYVQDTRHAINYSVTCEQFYKYDIWADELWEKTKHSYMLIAVRDAETLNILYPSNSPRFIKLLIKENGKIIGWAVVLDTQMKNHSHFGNMRVGSIVDSLSLPEDALKVILAASRYLEKRGIDIIVANYSHREWGIAFRKNGFLQWQSNFIFAASKDLIKHINPLQENTNKIFMCRGDGDGPSNL